MAKTKISEYDSTAANNTDIDSINIAEGMAPSNVNNAIRELMAHLKDGLGAGTPVFLDQTNNRLGVGTDSPESGLHLFDGTNVGSPQNSSRKATLTIEAGSEGSADIQFLNASYNHLFFGDAADANIGYQVYDHTNNSLQFGVNAAERMRITSSGNVELNGLSNGTLKFAGGNTSNGSKIQVFDNAGTGDGYLAIEGYTTEYMRLDASGNLGVGQTSPSAKIHASISSVASTKTEVFRVSDEVLCDFKVFLDRGTNLATSVSRVNTASGIMAFETSNTERMRIDSSGNVGFGGVTSPAAGFGVSGCIDTNGAYFARGQISAHQTNAAVLQYGGNLAELRAYGATSGSGQIRFMTGGGGGAADTERMRISSTGRVGIGRNDPSIFLDIYTASSGTFGQRIRADNAGTQYFATFEYAGSAIGSITGNNTSTAYNTSSDYRLKENITDITDGITRVKQLEPRRFNFIVDPDKTVDGFIAHEAQAVVPEAITGTKDAMKDEEYQVSAATGDIYTPATEEAEEVIHNSNVAEPETLEEGQQWRETTAAVMGTRSVPDYQGIDQAKLVPLLTAALQEAIAKIEALETRVAALEG